MDCLYATHSYLCTATLFIVASIVPIAHGTTIEYSNPSIANGKYTSALQWSGYTKRSDAENGQAFTHQYPAHFIDGFVAFDAHTCATWDPDPSVRDKYKAHTASKSAQDCVRELDKPENHMYYGVTYAALVSDKGMRPSMFEWKGASDIPRWKWDVSPTRSDYFPRSAGFETQTAECFFIKNRCLELLPVKFVASGQVTSADLPGSVPWKNTMGKQNGVSRQVQFRYYSPPWSKTIKLGKDNGLPLHMNTESSTGQNTLMSVVTFLRQRPFTGIPMSMPYARPNHRTVDEHIVDHAFSLPNTSATLPGFSRVATANTQEHFEIVQVHEVSDPRNKLGPSKFDPEYSLVRRGHRCGSAWTSGASTFTRTMANDGLLIDKGLAGTPLDCAKACTDVGGGWFLRGALTRQCQCYKTMSACHPVVSPGTDLFEFGTDVPSVKYDLVKAGALCVGISSLKLRYHAGTRASVSLCAHACRDYSQFFAYDASTKGCLCDLPQEGDAGCTSYKTSGSTQVQPLPELSGTPSSVEASAFSLYRYKGDDFFLKKQNGCCVDTSRPSVLDCNSIQQQQASGSISWVEIPTANTLVGCSRACHGMSDLFIYKMYPTATCYCLLRHPGSLQHLHNNSYTRAPNYALVADGTNVQDRSGDMWTLDQCRKTCDNTNGCAMRGFSWMRINGQNNCRWSVSEAATVRYIDPNMASTDLSVTDKALIGFYRVDTKSDFKCKHEGTSFVSNADTDAKRNRYRLYSFEAEPLLIQRDSVCSTGVTSQTISNNIKTRTECAEACLETAGTPWFAYGRERATDGSLTGMCTMTKLTKKILKCNCRCQKMHSGFDCSIRTPMYGMDLFFYPGTIAPPRTPTQKKLLASDPNRVDFSELKCAWKVTESATCFKPNSGSTDINAFKIITSQSIRPTDSLYRKQCTEDTAGACLGYSALFGDDTMRYNGHLRMLVGCDAVHTFATLPTSQVQYTSGTHYEYLPSACSCAWETIPGYTCQGASTTGLNLLSSTPRYASSVEEASRMCVALRNTECKYGFSHSATKNTNGKYTLYFAQSGRCDSVGGGKTATNSIYVRFAPEECLPSTGPSVSNLDDIYTIYPIKKETDDTKLSCAWTVHKGKMCVDPKAYRWVPKSSARYRIQDSITTRGTEEMHHGVASQWTKTLDSKWGESSNCGIIDDFMDKPIRAEGMIKNVSDYHASILMQNGDDVTGFNYNMGGNDENSYGWQTYGDYKAMQFMGIPKERRACNLALQQSFGGFETVYQWQRPIEYERGRRELYQWGNFVASKANRQCVMVPVTDGSYFEHHPWKCKQCGKSHYGKSCRRQTLYTRSDLFSMNTNTDNNPSSAQVKSVELPVISNWLSDCREHCRADGPRCNAFVIDEAFGSYKCITLRASTTSTTRHDPLVEPVAQQRYSVGTISRSAPSWQIVKGRVLDTGTSDTQHGSITLQQCMDMCNGNKTCHMYGFSFHKTSDADWDKSSPTGECRMSKGVPTKDIVPTSNVKESALYYRSNITWNKLHNVKCTGDHVLFPITTPYTPVTLQQCKAHCEHAEHNNLAEWGMCKKFGFSFTPDGSTDKGECRIPKPLHITNTSLFGTNYRPQSSTTGFAIRSTPNTIISLNYDGYPIVDVNTCERKCRESAACRRFGFSVFFSTNVLVDPCRIPKESTQFPNTATYTGSTWYTYKSNEMGTLNGLNIENTDTYYHYDPLQSAGCDTDKKCLRNHEPFRPCQSEYSVGSTLYFPQTRIEPPTVLTVHSEAQYTFSTVPGTRCTSSGRNINGISTSPLSSEWSNNLDDNTFILSIETITLSKCKQMCMGTPGCLKHGFSFGSRSGVSYTWSGDPNENMNSGKAPGSIGINKGFLLGGANQYDSFLLRPKECYHKCLDTPGCIETGFSWTELFPGGQYNIVEMQTYMCRIPKVHSSLSSYYLESMIPKSNSYNAKFKSSTFYRANTCFLPHFDASSPCKRSPDPSGINAFYTIAPKDATTTSVEPSVDTKQLLNWTNLYSGVRNSVYYADKTYSTSPAYAPNLGVPLNHAPSNTQIGEKVSPAFDWSEAIDIPTSYVGNDRYQDLVASFCRFKCARTLSCVSFKVDMVSLTSGCWLYGPSTYGTTGTFASTNNVTGAQPDPNGYLGITYSMTKAYEAQSVETINGIIDMLGIEYGDLLSPVPYSFSRVELYEYVHDTEHSGQKQCPEDQSHVEYGVTLERCKQMRRQLRVSRSTDPGEYWTMSKGETTKTKFSYREATQSTASKCIIPKTGADCTAQPASGQGASRIYRVGTRKVLQLYSKRINPWIFKEIKSIKACALKCMSLYMQGCRVFTYSSTVDIDDKDKVCYLFPLDETRDVPIDGSLGKNAEMVFTRFKENAGYKSSPSYYVTHPSMYMKLDIGLYEYINDFGTENRCAAFESQHVIPNARNIEVSASNALVECADRCSRAGEDFPGGTLVGGRMSFGCDAFSIEVPNLCTLYTRCDSMTRVPANATTWNYRVRRSQGPFVYSGTPSQGCVTEYEDLALGASAVNGPVHKDTAENSLQQCMDLCATHHTRAAQLAKISNPNSQQHQYKGCGGFSLSDSGECRLHGPCKLSTNDKGANGAAVTNVVTYRTVQNSFKFHGGHTPDSDPRNAVIRDHPRQSPAYGHSSAWGRAVDSFCSIQYGSGWRAASTKDAKAYAQYGSARARRWKDGFGYFTNVGQAQWTTSTTDSANYAACFRPPVPRRYYQFPTSVSVFTRIPQMNYACSATPLLRHNGIVGSDTNGRNGKDLLWRCADACAINAQGLRNTVNGKDEPIKNSGCVGFTVSTAGHCDLHVSCNAQSVYYVEPEMNLIRVSYSMEASDFVAGGD